MAETAVQDIVRQIALSLPLILRVYCPGVILVSRCMKLLTDWSVLESSAILNS